jgi:hypothetical protein
VPSWREDSAEELIEIASEKIDIAQASVEAGTKPGPMRSP